MKFKDKLITATEIKDSFDNLPKRLTLIIDSLNQTDYINKFNNTGKAKFLKLLENFKKLPVICPKCCKDTKSYNKGLICCDYCNNWFHFKCVNLINASVNDWYCENCQETQ